MIDFHNHILPNVDDGSKSVEMSLNMLRKAQRQGITNIINTVHYQHPKMKDKNTSNDFIISEIGKLQSIANENNINIKIHPGSEVFFNFNLVEILDNPISTIGNGKYMLIEFQTLSFPKGYENEIFKLQTNNVIPIIAHPERYRPIQNDLSILESWIEKSYLIQLDCGSLLGHFGKNTEEKGLYHFLGSDTHNDKKRNFCLVDALEIVMSISGTLDAEIIKNNLKNILNGGEIKKCKGVIKKTFFQSFKKWF